MGRIAPEVFRGRSSLPPERMESPLKSNPLYQSLKRQEGSHVALHSGHPWPSRPLKTSGATLLSNIVLLLPRPELFKRKVAGAKAAVRCHAD